MATWYLINTVQVGLTKYKSGSTIDDAVIHTGHIVAAGGKLVSTSVTALAAPAAVAVNMWRKGKSQSECDAVMLAAYEQAKDTVDVEGAHTHAIANGVAPVITVAKLRQQQAFIPIAPGGNYHAQFGAGAAIDHALLPGDQLIVCTPSRTVQIARGGAGVATNYTVDGTDDDGNVIQEVIAVPGAGTVQGTRAFRTITRVRSDVDPQTTTDFQVGNGFGLGGPASDIDALSCNNVDETIVASHAATGTVVPTTVPNATRVFTVRYRVLPTATNAAHNHTGTSGAGSAHSHTLS